MARRTTHRERLAAAATAAVAAARVADLPVSDLPLVSAVISAGGEPDDGVAIAAPQLAPVSEEPVSEEPTDDTPRMLGDEPEEVTLLLETAADIDDAKFDLEDSTSETIVGLARQIGAAAALRDVFDGLLAGVTRPAPAAAIPAPVPAAAEQPKLPRGAKYAMTDWVAPLVPNPKKPGTEAWSCFEYYGRGTTVQAYLEDSRMSRRRAREALQWDLARKLVGIVPRPASAGEAQ